jgi:hypothetical protein
MLGRYKFKTKINKSELDYIKRIHLSEKLNIHSNKDISTCTVTIYMEENKQPNIYRYIYIWAYIYMGIYIYSLIYILIYIMANKLLSE